MSVAVEHRCKAGRMLSAHFDLEMNHTSLLGAGQLAVARQADAVPPALLARYDSCTVSGMYMVHTICICENYLYIYIHMHIYICIYVCICIHIYMYTYIC